MSESFLSEIPEKASESLSEVVFPKLFRPKVLDFNVSTGTMNLYHFRNEISWEFLKSQTCDVISRASNFWLDFRALPQVRFLGTFFLL